jgi:GT2 family glycosyltransferase
VSAAIAVIIPCHNHGQFLAGCVASVRRQHHPAAELLVVDDASTDDTAAVCESLGVRRILSQGTGPHAARGTGFAVTTAPWVCFLDADDEIGCSYLADAAAKFAPGVGMVFSDMVRFGAQTGRFHARPRDISAENYYHVGSVARRIALDAAGVFDAAVPSSVLEDWFTWRAVLASGWRAVKSPGVYFYRRHGANGTTRWEQFPYVERADLPREQVTIAVPLSGRRAWWPRLRQWLERQTWPVQQTQILLVDNSGDEVFGREVRAWLAGCAYSGTQYLTVPGIRGLADADRYDHTTYRRVQKAMPRIYTALRRAVTTPYVLIVEDDVLPPVTAVADLLMSCCPATASVTGVYRSRFQRDFVLWRADDSRPTALGHGVERIGGNGFGCVLFRTSALRAVPLHHGGPRGDYDPNFYADMRTIAPHLVAKVNWSVLCDHAGIPADPAAPPQPAPPRPAMPVQIPPTRLLDVPACASETQLAILVAVFSAAPATRPRQNYHRFLAAAEASGAPVYVIECAIGGADFWVPDRPGLVRVRAPHVGWHKERLLNILERVVPPRFTKLAWIDADVLFDDADWVGKAERQLDTAPVIQLFDRALWLHPDNHNVAIEWPGMAGLFAKTRRELQVNGTHPGFAWAMRRDFWRAQDGLLDTCGTMSADSLMAASWCGRNAELWSEHRSPQVATWCARARRLAAGRVGALGGSVRHLWHGPLRQRQYTQLWKQLAAAGWCGDSDLVMAPRYPLQLPYQLARPAIFEPIYLDFFARRDEDSTCARDDQTTSESL